MAEHQIRLRGGWEADMPDQPGDVPARLTLPVSRNLAASRRLRLVRRFGRPAVDRSTQETVLRLDRVPGLVAVRLNGRDLTPGTAAGPIEIPLDNLPPRNELELLVDWPEPAFEGWGHVALVIRDRPAPSPPLGLWRSDG